MRTVDFFADTQMSSDSRLVFICFRNANLVTPFRADLSLLYRNHARKTVITSYQPYLPYE